MQPVTEPANKAMGKTTHHGCLGLLGNGCSVLPSPRGQEGTNFAIGC